MSITESQQSLTSPHCYYWSSHSLCPLHPHKQPLMLAFSFMISLGLIQSSSHTELLQNRRCWCWGAAVLFNPNSAWAQTNQAEGIKGGGGDQYSSMLPPHAKPKSLKENIDRRARKRCVCGPPSHLSQAELKRCVTEAQKDTLSRGADIKSEKGPHSKFLWYKEGKEEGRSSGGVVGGIKVWKVPKTSLLFLTFPLVPAHNTICIKQPKGRKTYQVSSTYGSAPCSCSYVTSST